MDSITNQVTLRGTLASPPRFSHENHGKRFFRFYLDIPRLSAAVDTLPVVAPEALLERTPLEEGSMLLITGQIRSHNQRSDGQRRLLIFVFAQSIEFQNGEPVNQVTLEGPLCREPTYRRTPLGREICDVMLAVPRPFHRADYLPCILWGKVAAQASGCNVGDRLLINGRLQSRIYTKLTEEGFQERTAYEISALTAQFPEPVPEAP